MANSSLDKMNKLIEQASNAIACGPDCQRKKKEEELKKKLLDSKTNLQSAPGQYEAASKKYYTFTQGSAGYNDIREAELREKADLITSTFESGFEDDIRKATTEIETYDGLRINFLNVFDLYVKYVRENKELENEIKQTSSDILTNDRKTYYEEQGIDNLKFYYSIFRIIYMLSVVLFAVLVFVLPTQLKIISKIGVIVFLVAFPFISTTLLTWAMDLYAKMVGVLPVNVHTTV
jgi:hypothetical protein